MGTPKPLTAAESPVHVGTVKVGFYGIRITAADDTVSGRLEAGPLNYALPVMTPADADALSLLLAEAADLARARSGEK